MMMMMIKTTITSVFDPSYKKVTYKKNIRIMRMNHHLRTIRQLFLTLISFILLLQAPFTSSIVTPESYIQKTPVVICPGFGNDQIDYIEPLKQPREKGFLAALERRGFDPSLLSIVPIQRRDWLRVAGGLKYWNFWLYFIFIPETHFPPAPVTDGTFNVSSKRLMKPTRIVVVLSFFV